MQITVGQEIIIIAEPVEVLLPIRESAEQQPAKESKGAEGKQLHIEEDRGIEDRAQNIKKAVRDADVSPKAIAKSGKKAKHTEIQQTKRSVNTQQAFQRLINMQRQCKCFIIALMEPFQNCRHLQKYKRRLGMEAALSNTNGKIWVFLDSEMQWEIVLDTEQQLTLKLQHQGIEKDFLATFVYAKCDGNERPTLWDNIYQIADSMNLPWMVGGEFNVILADEEKLGGLPVTLDECEDFAFCINSCGLLDMGFKGSLFTWWNGRSAEDCIFKRLDRILVNNSLQEMFPQIEIEHLIRTGSDHDPLLMSCGEEVINVIKPFRFLNFWVQHESFKDLVSQHWRTEFVGTLYLVFKEEVVKVKEALFEEDPSIVNRIVLQKAQAELKKYLHFEEQYWRQKQGLHESIHCDGDTTDFEIVKHVATMVDHEQNMGMCAYPNKDEVKETVFALSGESASSLDGFTGIFISNVGILLEMILISLSNFVNKVTSRVLHGRLERLMPRLISPNQSGFVKGRSIFENILLTQEIVLDIRLREKPANVVIKLDMAKAYDRVSWKRLVDNNRYSILLNGRATGFFKSSRGVKQGDPLSPALFSLSTEVLSRALNSLFDDSRFIGYGMPKWTYPMNHLDNADDTIIFASADDYSLICIMQVLSAYEQTSGHLINKGKSSYFMHSKIGNEMLQRVGDIMRFAK
ncbi:uncharacterized protein LOC132057813 [Lycium ferocissimum]|uniref:uncharacterized protein LOC132057813 n=1 Tax=Lycium ferocissimum TaxID=112874 RepID=UPI00281661CE|nr:uncharacterized protein LOC132057813 [Lycium ferocissimum]